MGAEALGAVGRCGFAALAKELEHGGAGVDGVGVEVRVVGEELGEEAAVSVAEDESALLLRRWGGSACGSVRGICRG